MKYYSAERPIAPGSIPVHDGNKILNIKNYDNKRLILGSGLPIAFWGVVEYEHPLSEKECEDYELIPDGSQKWYCLQTLECQGVLVKMLLRPSLDKIAVSRPEAEIKKIGDREMKKIWLTQEEAEEFE